MFVWGLVIVVVGMLLFAAAITESRFFVYRLLVARSRILWGDKVYRFHQVAGVLVIVAGLMVAIGLLG